MPENNRCLYNNNFIDFYSKNNDSIFGKLCDRYHMNAQTSTREAWKEEISIIMNLIARYINEDSQVIFKYDISCLGKEIDIVLLFKGIIFCLEFKVEKIRENSY